MTIKLSFAHKPPNFVRPELLKHPPIPQRLFYINPRLIKGQEWWDVTRKQIYKANNYCCWACGRHKSEDKFHQWLEAHEWFDYDFSTCVASLVEVVGLCPTCHMYIHLGSAMRKVEDGDVSVDELRQIVLHGTKILRDANLSPNWAAWLVGQRLFNDTETLNLIKPTAHEVSEELSHVYCEDRWTAKIDTREYYYDVAKGEVVCVK